MPLWKKTKKSPSDSEKIRGNEYFENLEIMHAKAIRAQKLAAIQKVKDQNKENKASALNAIVELDLFLAGFSPAKKSPAKISPAKISPAKLASALSPAKTVSAKKSPTKQLTLVRKMAKKYEKARNPSPPIKITYTPLTKVGTKKTHNIVETSFGGGRHKRTRSKKTRKTRKTRKY